MKKVIVLFFMMIILVVTACSGNDSSEDSDKNNAEESQANEDTAEVTTDSNEEEEEKEDSTEGTTGDPVVLDAEQLLIKSAEAMEGLSSYYGESHYIDDTTINGINEKIETTATVKMILSDSTTSMHMVSNSESANTDSTGDVEMYMVEEATYMKSEGEWFSMPNTAENKAMYETFTVLQEDQLQEYVDKSNSFEVIDNGDQYVLSFTGDDEEYKSFVMGGSIAVLSEVVKEHVANLKVSGTYQIIIDKETFYVNGHKISYNSSTTGEMGEVETTYEGSYKISNFNEYNEITVPQEVVDQAKSLGQ